MINHTGPEYADNAACVYLEEGHHINVEQNLIHDCGNGIFASSGVSDLVISGNHVFDNGNAGSVYEHTTSPGRPPGMPLRGRPP